MSNIGFKGASAAALTVVLAGGLAACGETVSSGSFSGESKAVAQVISNFQSDVSSADEKSLCQKDLASNIRGGLSKGGGCQQTIKKQLGQLDTFTLKISSIDVKGTSATARVSSTYSGKSKMSTLDLVKEGTHWRISGLS
ncbi:MAG TPA: hypothetical protein VID48_15460 [Solirubrobacteraceae bacterium]|jgi:hypothetical protein